MGARWWVWWRRVWEGGCGAAERGGGWVGAVVWVRGEGGCALGAWGVRGREGVGVCEGRVWVCGGCDGMDANVTNR